MRKSSEVVREIQQLPLDILKVQQTVEAFQRVQVADGKDMVLIIGNTGSGKSTAINYLLGCNMKQVKNSTNSKQIIIVDDAEIEYARIGHSISSQTQFPEAFQVKNADFVYCDFPGFSDNRGIEQQICTAISAQMAIRTARSVRSIMVFIDYVTMDVDRYASLRKLAITLANFFKEPEIVRNYLYFVFTKIPRFDSITGQEIPKGQIKEEIKCKIAEVEQSIHDTSQFQSSEAIEILRVLQLIVGGCNRYEVIENQAAITSNIQRGIFYFVHKDEDPITQFVYKNKTNQLVYQTLTTEQLGEIITILATSDFNSAVKSGINQCVVTKYLLSIIKDDLLEDKIILLNPIDKGESRAEISQRLATLQGCQIPIEVFGFSEHDSIKKALTEAMFPIATQGERLINDIFEAPNKIIVNKQQLAEETQLAKKNRETLAELIIKLDELNKQSCSLQKQIAELEHRLSEPNLPQQELDALNIAIVKLQGEKLCIDTNKKQHSILHDEALKMELKFRTSIGKLNVEITAMEYAIKTAKEGLTGYNKIYVLQRDPEKIETNTIYLILSKGILAWKFLYKDRTGVVIEVKEKSSILEQTIYQLIKKQASSEDIVILNGILEVSQQVITDQINIKDILEERLQNPKKEMAHTVLLPTDRAFTVMQKQVEELHHSLLIKEQVAEKARHSFQAKGCAVDAVTSDKLAQSLSKLIRMYLGIPSKQDLFDILMNFAKIFVFVNPEIQFFLECYKRKYDDLVKEGLTSSQFDFNGFIKVLFDHMQEYIKLKYIPKEQLLFQSEIEKSREEQKVQEFKKRQSVYTSKAPTGEDRTRNPASQIAKHYAPVSVSEEHFDTHRKCVVKETTPKMLAAEEIKLRSVPAPVVQPQLKDIASGADDQQPKTIQQRIAKFSKP